MSPQHLESQYSSKFGYIEHNFPVLIAYFVPNNKEN